MTDSDLSKQIAKRQRAIARFEARAVRCNVATDLGRAIATRAEDLARYHRKHLEKLQELLKNLGERDDLCACAATDAVTDSAVIGDSA
jgi:hypothetical protein